MFAITIGGSVFAHDGPPFPVIMDEPIPGYMVSVWADPDIGTGTFYVMTDPVESSSSPAEAPEVEVWVQPKNGRLPKSNYIARRQDLRNRIQFIAEPAFDQQEMFVVGIVVANADGKRTELLTEVEATPPGLGPWDLAIYLFPFVMFGGLWVIAFFKRRRPANHSQRPTNLDENRLENDSSSPNDLIEDCATH